MVALMLIGMVMALVGFGLCGTLPVPSSDSPMWKFIPVIMMFLGLGLAAGSLIVLAWKFAP